MANSFDEGMNKEANGAEGAEATPRLIERTMEEVLHASMIPYSEYVILDRALPRVEDGLKPVQRRILYSMNELGITPDKPYKKSARIVGDCLGKYHPHGDSSIYQAMVRMAQDFSMGVKLVDGHGNYGSIDGDGAAAMRYTEARMAPLALELLRDLDKNTVKWSCNFDDTTKEPDYLPGRFPNLLVNGASGIAVGLATNIPPHNITEAISGVIAYIDKRSISLADMMKIIRGPDFPTGGFLIENELVKAYETGRGKVTLRAKVHLENGDNDKKLIVIDELPYQVNKATLLENILKIREEKKGVLAGISEITDESDRTGMRAVIKVKKDYNVQEILDALFKSTNLQITFGINMVAIAGGKPQQMGLLDIIAYYVDYQREVIYRRTRFELDQVKERVHILEGLVIAVRNIDEVIKIIKSSQNTTEARERLRKTFSLTERQAQAILDLRLARLTHLEIFKLEKELAELRELAERLSKILSSKVLQMEVVKTELMQIMRTFKAPRKTQIIKSAEDYTVENESEEREIEDSIVAFSAFGEIKRMSVKHFNMATRAFTENSTRNEIYTAITRVNSAEKLLCFTNLGNCYKLGLDEIPEAKWRERGTKLVEVIGDLLLGERIVFAHSVGEGELRGDLLFYTKEGMVKKTALNEYNLVKSTFQAIKLKENDEVIGMELQKKGMMLLFVTEKGMCLNADMSDIPTQGRISGGVKGIQLATDDCVVFAGQTDGSDRVTLLTSGGLVKNVELCEIDMTARYRKGVKIIDLAKSGKEACLIHVSLSTKIKTVVVHYPSGDLIAYSTGEFKTEARIHPGRPIIRPMSKPVSAYPFYDSLTS